MIHPRIAQGVLKLRSLQHHAHHFSAIAAVQEKGQFKNRVLVTRRPPKGIRLGHQRTQRRADAHVDAAREFRSGGEQSLFRRRRWKRSGLVRLLVFSLAHYSCPCAQAQPQYRFVRPRGLGSASGRLL